jgi:hypothetical protein
MELTGSGTSGQSVSLPSGLGTALGTASFTSAVWIRLKTVSLTEDGYTCGVKSVAVPSDWM